MKAERLERLVALLETAADNARKARESRDARDLVLCARSVALAADLLAELEPEGEFVKHLRRTLN